MMMMIRQPLCAGYLNIYVQCCNLQARHIDVLVQRILCTWIWITHNLDSKFNSLLLIKLDDIKSTDNNSTQRQYFTP